MRHRFASFVNDKARTVYVRELFNAFCCDYLDKFYLSVFYSDLRQIVINQVAKFVTVLIQVKHYKVFSWSVCDLSDVLISGDFDDLAVLDFLSLGLELGHSGGVELFCELIILIEIVFDLFELGLVFTGNEVLNFILFSMLLLHDGLLFVESGFLFKGDIISVFNLNVEPLSGNFVGHEWLVVWDAKKLSWFLMYNIMFIYL